MRIATWNVNSLKARLPRVEGWLAEVGPDVLLLQETKLADSAFPALAFQALGYETFHHGEGRWNGVAIVSKVGIDDAQPGWTDGGPPDPDARIAWATCGGVRVASVYVPNGRELGHDHYRYKLDWLARLRSHLADHHRPDDPIVVAGDFNIAPTDLDVWDPDLFVGSTHVSEPEREALRALEAWGLHDTYRRLHPEPGHYTYWDYRAGAFHKGMGMRIDLLLATAPVADRVTDAVMHRDARKGTKPSDHAPVSIEIEGLPDV